MRTPLHIAVLHHQTEVVSLLLEWEADYKIEDCVSCTVLYKTLSQGGFIELPFYCSLDTLLSIMQRSQTIEIYQNL